MQAAMDQQRMEDRMPDLLLLKRTTPAKQEESCGDEGLFELRMLRGRISGPWVF